ncbi:MAG TPA: GNAT family N-acetyltransferase [Microbacterium sp.]|uniref:GNAT family N-acetyltransferase n=1 Tax=unclassified Microbacterium TaxID=2609290 RepID=UPI000C373E65|nr:MULTISPECIES: GNAT family N-acetyltransferase [unclassified Microbacterium]MBU20473.1 GNAT family N-acetyltransferase [Microbacterium sp.]HBS07299.1 GNAT family N-acetyltransferase [Microbacterium sp.]HBU42246.1 GNAT family N-acetyltransferase [Microbacterium sp.]
MARIRAFRPEDKAALSSVCIRTADAGADAKGILTDDEIWPEVFLRPYLARHPDYAFVVDVDGEPVGYLVCAPDTRSFEDWFSTSWWPERRSRWAPDVDAGDPRAERTAGILRYAAARRAGAEPYGDAYPAHLHIDLLPQAQGQGWGRRLIDALIETLRERGVSGVHLVADAANTSALAFYDRLGFARLASHEGVQAFGMSLGGPEGSGPR